MTNTDFTARCMAGKALDDVAGKQDALTTEQLAAVNSGITSADVVQITSNKNNISSLWDNGAKNHYKITATQSTTGITYTKVSESELSISGTYTGSTYVYFNLTGNNFKLPAGTWKFRFTTTGTVPNRSVTFAVQGQGSTTASKDTDYEFTTTGEEYLTAYIQFLTNDAVDGSIRIMVRPVNATDPTYQPYAMSNAELTVGKADLTEVITKGERYVANQAKTYTLESSTTYLITVISYAVAGVFLAFKYNNETSPRLYTVYKAQNFDSSLTVEGVANSSDISITAMSSSTWFISNIAKL